MKARDNLKTNLTDIKESGLIKGGWLIVALLCVAGGLNYLDRTMITTMRTSIIGAMPMSDAQLYFYGYMDYSALSRVFLPTGSPVAG